MKKKTSRTHHNFLSAKTCTEEALLEEEEARTFVLATTLVPTKEETAKDIFLWSCNACVSVWFFSSRWNFSARNPKTRGFVDDRQHRFENEAEKAVVLIFSFL